MTHFCWLTPRALYVRTLCILALCVHCLLSPLCFRSALLPSHLLLASFHICCFRCVHSHLLHLLPLIRYEISSAFLHPHVALVCRCGDQVHLMPTPEQRVANLKACVPLELSSSRSVEIAFLGLMQAARKRKTEGGRAAGVVI